MVGHRLDISMSLIAGQITGWAVPLQGKKIFVVQRPSSLNMWMKILLPQAKLELQDYAQEPAHTVCTQTPKLVLPLCSVRGSESVMQAVRKRSRCLTLRLLSSCNANMAQPAAFLAPWPTGITAHIPLHTVSRLFPILTLQGLLQNKHVPNMCSLVSAPQVLETWIYRSQTSWKELWWREELWCWHLMNLTWSEFVKS